MDVTIIGTGNMARGIATRALAGAGPLALAGKLEALGYLHMAIQESLGTNFGSGIKIVA